MTALTTRNYQTRPSGRSQTHDFNPNLALKILASRNFDDFIAYTKPDYRFNWHHRNLADKLQAFSRGEITKLMVFMPPQHGKSQMCTRHFPAYMLGVRPDCKICVCSYASTLAQAFNRDIQRIIDDIPYHEIFPQTILNQSNVTTNAHGAYLRNANQFETVNYRGFVKTVGVGGSLTGTPIDIGIIDDPFKDREEAMSIRIREKVWSWFTDVFETRLHNESQVLVIMTRWDEDDLAGRILARDGADWTVVSYPAIKEREDPEDPRSIGEALWPQHQSLERIIKIKEDSPFTFNSLYQQEPQASSEALVLPDWDVYLDPDEPNTEPLIGVDFGFSNDPTAVIQVKIHKKAMYVRQLIYQRRMLNSELDLKMSYLGLKSRRIAADSADPKTIEEFKTERKYLGIVPSIKGPDSVIAGINWIKDHKLFVHKDSTDLRNELLKYQWVMIGNKATNVPIDAHNHGIDAIRYTKTLLNTSGFTSIRARR